jgi:hypothetical protein
MTKRRGVRTAAREHDTKYGYRPDGDGVRLFTCALVPSDASTTYPFRCSVALAIIGLGLLIVIAPSSVPGLMPPM